MALAAIMFSTTTNASELWGAYVEAGEYWEEGEVNGWSWNFDTIEGAVERAMDECMRYDLCITKGPHKIHAFTSSRSESVDEWIYLDSYGQLDVYIIAHRCMAFDWGDGDYRELYGDSEYEVIDQFSYPEYIEEVVCNDW